MNMFRTLRADEIDCRIAQVKSKFDKDTKKYVPSGLTLLLYKDARCDQNILDETVGPMNWERKHSRENANCTVSIWDSEKKAWISKEDTGTESNTEKEKGLASDSFKRACFNWGIGRELYTAPFVWIKAADCKIIEDNGKFRCYDNFTVLDIGYTNGNISKLKIKNNATSKVVFDWKDSTEKPQQPDREPEMQPKPEKAQVNAMSRVPSGNPVQDYMVNELTFMKQIFGIPDTDEMIKKFSEMRKALIAEGTIEDVASDKQTMEQAKEMFSAIYERYSP